METQLKSAAQSSEQSVEHANIQGEVRAYHVARSRAVRRILERSIARWMELHQLLGRGRASTAGGVAGDIIPRYHAVLQREGEGHYIQCQIEVVAGEESWVGSRVGSGIQQALADCLAHMTRRQAMGQALLAPATV